MTGFDVYLNGRIINTVYYHDDMSVKEVKDSLINHDGFDPRIKVVKKQ